MQNDLIITACRSLGCLLLVTATVRVCIFVSWNMSTQSLRQVWTVHYGEQLRYGLWCNSCAISLSLN